MLLMIDNYDSFTYNLVQYLSELGADVKVHRNDEIDSGGIKRLKPQSIVLSPGPGRPENAGNLLSIIEDFAGHIPILGVCLGHQAIAQVFGATITYAPCLMHGKTSEVLHGRSRLFKSIPSPFIATRYHSLVVERITLSKEFRITAETDDGVIMAIENSKKKLYGLQFHPESIMTPDGKKILNNFLELV